MNNEVNRTHKNVIGYMNGQLWYMTNIKNLKTNQIQNKADSRCYYNIIGFLCQMLYDFLPYVIYVGHFLLIMRKSEHMFLCNRTKFL